MRISVITVTYNSAATIEHTLRSFVSQDYCNKELVIIDGGSSDATIDIVERFRISDAIIVSEADRGIYDAMNKGLRLYSGEAFGFLNSDDKFSSSMSLSSIAEGLKKTDTVYGHLRFVNSHEQSEAVRFWHASSRPQSGFKSGWAPPHPTFYCRRSVSESVGDFDTTFRIAADYDWMLRALDIVGVSDSVVNALLVDQMLGGVSTRSLQSRLIGNVEKLKARQKNFGSAGLDIASIAMPISKLKQLFHS